MRNNQILYTLSLPEMQSQHEYLHLLFSSIEEHEQVTDHTFFSLLLKEIEQYLLFHFESEEHFMRMYDYDGFAVHQSEHEYVANRFIQYADDFESGRCNPKNLKNFLHTWLSEHAYMSDRLYVEWVENRRRRILRSEP